MIEFPTATYHPSHGCATVLAVDVGEFWGLVERAVRECAGRRARATWLQERLSGRGATDILDFEVHLDDASDRAMTWLMWGAATRIVGPCTDDTFHYLRNWLMTLGRETFERVVADPDSLALVPQVRQLAARDRIRWRLDEWPEWEELDYAAGEAWEGVRGAGANIYRAVEQHRPHPRLPTLQDERWDLADPAEAARRLPRLTTLFSRSAPPDRAGAEAPPQGPWPAAEQIPGQLVIPGLLDADGRPG
ncbi:DUF4240 domain-containing protein [Catellatospora bangladeshensis]|uniref:DUF4240 domain-containing protein n=1 Tax=Catellatospora bangladeshensis TaxID=310355 RepID=A0A8J3JSP4_9ACTN|nr:DUF4240 domain-containing protein [Catellatospora bangladeshensis]GIF86326.1 hypothetical protein Cba03nite_76750 [Catellatospora bangladeshensis]